MVNHRNSCPVLLKLKFHIWLMKNFIAKKIELSYSNLNGYRINEMFNNSYFESHHQTYIKDDLRKKSNDPDIANFLILTIKILLGYSDSDNLDINQSLLSLGIDSLLMIELFDKIHIKYNIKLLPENINENLTIKGLAKIIAVQRSNIPKIKKIWFCFLSIFYFVYHSMIIVFYSNLPNKKKDIPIQMDILAKKLLKVVKASYKIHDLFCFQLNPNKPLIIMSNHSSLYDAVLITLVFKIPLLYIGRRNLTKIPLIGKAFQAMGMIPIDRKRIAQSKLDYDAIKNQIQNGKVLWICPEGMRTRTSEIMPFEIAAFRLAREIKADILPVAIDGTYDILPAHTIDFNENCHVDVYIGKLINACEYNAINQMELINLITEFFRKNLGELKKNEQSIIRYNIWKK